MKILKPLVLLLLYLYTFSPPAAGIKPYSGALENPPLALSALDGQHYNLENYRGQVVLVNFWATWCPPCVEELPSLQRLQHHFKDRPFRILTVDVGEEPDLIQDFLNKVDTPMLTVLLDKQGKAHKDWNIYVFPTSFLLDNKGTIRYGIIGALPWDDTSVIQAIEKLLAESPN